jgi:hypothetical protein
VFLRQRELGREFGRDPWIRFDSVEEGDLAGTPYRPARAMIAALAIFEREEVDV